MSVQLILKPQNVQGFTNDVSYITSDMVSNGATFNGVDVATGYTATSGNVIEEVLLNAPATIPNTWYKFKQTASVSFPTTTSGNLVFTNDPEDNLIGIYQQLTDLIVGQVYTVTIYLSATPVDYVFFLQPEENAGIMAFTEIFSGTGTTQTCQFTAQMENPTIFFSAFSTGSSVTTISVFNITVIGASESITILSGNGEVICDLYEDEDLPLTLSVDEFKNVAEKVQSYSKAFKLPATKRNNRIFDAIFEITRAYDGLIFNPYRRTECILKQDGFILFQGYLRLIEVIDKEGEISYNVNLYSEVVALADVLTDRTFDDLSFLELEHDYNRIQIGYSWNDDTTGITYTNPSTSGFRNAYSTVKYPFVDWNHQYTIGSTGNPQLTNLESSFRPFINIKYLIDRIFSAPNTPFTYSSDFFNTTDFKKLYMDFNWGGTDFPVAIDSSGLGYPSVDQALTSSYQTITINTNNFPTAAGYSAGVFSPVNDNTKYYIQYNHRIIHFATTIIRHRWVLVKGGVTTEIDQSNQSVTGFGSLFIYSSFTEYLDIGDTLHFEVLSTESVSFAELQEGDTSVEETILGISGFTASNNSLGQTLRGELGQWEFLKGIMTMFNLITIPDEDNPNNIIIEPYTDIFIKPALTTPPLDWTEKIDVSQMKLTPLTDLNLSTLFKFVEDDDDYPFNAYKNEVGGHLYGSYLVPDQEEFNILTGTKEIIAEPFAATIVKALMSQYSEFIIPQIYSYNSDDSTSEGFDNSPRIMYNNGVINVGTNYHIPAQNGETEININTALQFSHLSLIPTDDDTRDFNFGLCQLFPGVGSGTVNNLYNLYWKPYFNELYNPDTRIMTIQVNLSPADINTFKFNATVYIKNRTFRVNKIDYKPNDLATVEFILIP
jgi:hypothetical protein